MRWSGPTTDCTQDPCHGQPRRSWLLCGPKVCMEPDATKTTPAIADNVRQWRCIIAARGSLGQTAAGVRRRDAHISPRCLPFPPLTIIPPVRGRALRPWPSISTHRHQTAPCHLRLPVLPPPTGISLSKCRLKPIISTHRHIPTESALNPLLTSPASLCHFLSMRFLRRQQLSVMETDIPSPSKYQRGSLNMKLHHGKTQQKKSDHLSS